MVEKKDYSSQELGRLFHQLLEEHNWDGIREIRCDHGRQDMINSANGMSVSQRLKVGNALEKCEQAAKELFKSWGMIYSIFEESVLPEDDDGEDEVEPDEE